MCVLTDEYKKAIFLQAEQGMNAQAISDSFRQQGIPVSIGDVINYLSTEKGRPRRYVNNFIVWNGERHTLTEWSRITGLSVQTITQRLKKGWDLDRVFNSEVRVQKNNVSKLRMVMP